MRNPTWDGNRINYILQTPPSSRDIHYTGLQWQPQENDGSFGIPRDVRNDDPRYLQILRIEPPSFADTGYRLRRKTSYGSEGSLYSKWYVRVGGSNEFTVDTMDNDFVTVDPDVDPSGIEVFDNVAQTIPDIDAGRCS